MKSVVASLIAIVLLRSFLEAASKSYIFKVPNVGLVSVNVVRNDGVVLKRLIIGRHLPAGMATVSWDGLDDDGRPVPNGTYQIKGLVANIGVKYVATVGNSSPQPYGGICFSNPCNVGSWGGEYRQGL